MKQLLYLSLLICLLSQNYRDGKIFDSGLAMKKRADNAPLVLDKLNFMIGQWDIDFTYHPNDTTSISSQGKSEISFMNRGHGIMERNYIQNFNANDDEWNSMSFLAFNTVTKSWSIGIANSFTESIEILDGDFENNKLILRNAIRRLGGATLTYYNYSINQLNDRQFEMIMKTSTDHMKSWKTSYSCRYTKRQFSENFIGSSGTYGRAAEGLPAEARQFDFLIGAYDAQQEFLRPNANSIKFPSTTTAVYALNGSAILEFSWYNVDPSLPNASTSIIRIYNRAMRRWESLFMTNRGNGNLFFGGYKESDRIILTLFEHNTSDPRISRFVFHSVEKDSYKWYGENSSDHGKSYQKFWIIEMKKHTGDVTVN